MGEFNDCKPDKCNPCPPPCQPCGPCNKEYVCVPKCDNDGIGILGILIILVVLYCLFCGNNDKGGLFGGLF